MLFVVCGGEQGFWLPPFAGLIARGASPRERRDIIPGNTGGVCANNQELILRSEFQHANRVGNKEIALSVNRQAIGYCDAIDQRRHLSRLRVQGDNGTAYRDIEGVVVSV